MFPLTSNVVILCWKTLTSSENNARKIAEFLGAEVTVVSLTTVRDIESVRQLVPSCAALIVHADTLVRMAEVRDGEANGLLALIDLAPQIFVHGFETTDRHASILRKLSSGGLLGLAPLPTTGSTFRVADGYREWCGQFSGLSVQAVDRTKDACFVEGAPHDRLAVLIRAAGHPFFVRLDHGRSSLFFVASNELANPDEEVPSQVGLLPWFSRLVPLMMFLRGALGNRIWHSDNAQACFIIDDPLLQRRYGFLEYPRLLEIMGHERFSTSIAFIPWNYRRSPKPMGDLFSTAPGALSVCVHGCDHTRAEFAATGFELLRGKARLALERMQTHSQLSGIPFDDVMVFPQGLFSSQALAALSACGYLAAVNTDLCPSNVPQALTLRDLLDVAVTAFAGFPLFVRHYPRDPAEFAFDLFLGKPALVVEHHGYFRNGYEALGAFVKGLNELAERLEWSNLATICSRACLKRVTPQGDVHVRFYTSRFWLTNSGTRTETYVLFRRQTPEGPLPAVTVNGRPWAREQRDGSLKISLCLDAGQSADIRIVSEDPADATACSWKPTDLHNAKVLVRRLLCEFRDNYVERSRFFSGLLSSARKLRAREKGARGAGPQSIEMEGRSLVHGHRV